MKIAQLKGFFVRPFVPQGNRRDNANYAVCFPEERRVFFLGKTFEAACHILGNDLSRGE